jgi:hypothetical protein
MLRLRHTFEARKIHRFLDTGLLGAFSLYGLPYAVAQDTPLISGGAGFLTSTNGGNTTYIPAIVPVLEVPLGAIFLLSLAPV